jgi:outer membrane murein-binding lipoprotein Lpp
MNKHNKFLHLLASLIGCVLIASCANNTPGQKLDKAIDSAHQTARDVEHKYEDKKETVKQKTDQARKDVANKIKP